MLYIERRLDDVTLPRVGSVPILAEEFSLLCFGIMASI